MAREGDDQRGPFSFINFLTGRHTIKRLNKRDGKTKRVGKTFLLKKHTFEAVLPVQLISHMHFHDTFRHLEATAAILRERGGSSRYLRTICKSGKQNRTKREFDKFLKSRESVFVYQNQSTDNYRGQNNYSWRS